MAYHRHQDKVAGLHDFPVPTEVGDRASSQGWPSSRMSHRRAVSLSGSSMGFYAPDFCRSRDRGGLSQSRAAPGRWTESQLASAGFLDSNDLASVIASDLRTTFLRTCGSASPLQALVSLGPLPIEILGFIHDRPRSIQELGSASPLRRYLADDCIKSLAISLSERIGIASAPGRRLHGVKSGRSCITARPTQ